MLHPWVLCAAHVTLLHTHTHLVSVEKLDSAAVWFYSFRIKYISKYCTIVFFSLPFYMLLLPCFCLL
uniref:Putative secreted peptide n=1 Tax=Anopheles braziliensis TaxID=58242 RepID=A0A2M3ZXI5_9DIPT